MAKDKDTIRDAAQTEFLQHAKLMARYWASLPASQLAHFGEPEPLARLEGFAFSLFVAIDGGAAVGPYALKVLNEEGKETKIDIGGGLHDAFSRMKGADFKPGLMLTPVSEDEIAPGNIYIVELSDEQGYTTKQADADGNHWCAAVKAIYALPKSRPL